MVSWYCKVEDYTSQQIQDALDLCVDKGACAYISVNSAQVKYHYRYSYSLQDIYYFGVDLNNKTFLFRREGINPLVIKEITLDELPSHLGMLIDESKKKLDSLKKELSSTDKVKIDLLDEVCLSIFESKARDCNYGEVCVVKKMIENGWVKESNCG